jgi:hypothetical protein
MTSVNPCVLPKHALLMKYRNRTSDEDAEAYTDCYCTQIEDVVSLPDFVFAFYTTPVFKLERLILKYLARRPSTDDDAQNLADACSDRFAAWTVEERGIDQLLMCDFRGRTRSWFMVLPAASAKQSGTFLYFGSAVVPAEISSSGKQEIGKAFRLLLGFHKLYSVVLLHAARRRLASMRRQKRE